jgi:hypothetical protein
MNAKEKAHDLICNFYFALPNNGLSDSGINSTSKRWKEAKQCAIIAVDEILELTGGHINQFYQNVKTELTNF